MYYTIPYHTIQNFSHDHSNTELDRYYVVYYILMPYICQFQIGKQHFCSSTGVQMSSQNIHSIFGPSILPHEAFFLLEFFFLMNSHNMPLHRLWNVFLIRHFFNVNIFKILNDSSKRILMFCFSVKTSVIFHCKFSSTYMAIIFLNTD